MQPETTTLDPALATLDLWVEAGCLRPLDRALAAFLHNEGGETDGQVLLLAALTSQQLGDGHICLDLKQALAEPEGLFPAPVELTEADTSPTQWWRTQSLDALIKRLDKSPVVVDGPGDTPLVRDGTRLYLRRYWQYEQTVATTITERLASRFTPAADLRERLERLFPATPGRTDWQKIACALATRAGLTLITGGPGTGKTTTVVRLLGLLQELAIEDERPLRIKLAAPTGKAAARLSESIGAAVAALPVADRVKDALPTQPTTLHKLLGRRPNSRHFRHDCHSPLHADLVVVDEASMIDLEMMASLLDALRPETRLVLLGDKDQLASVEAGSVMGDLCREASGAHYSNDTLNWIRKHCGEDVNDFAGEGSALAQQTAMLRFSHRFGEGSGIGALARAVNAGDSDAATNIWQRGFDDIRQLPLTRPSDRTLERECLAGYGHYLEVLTQQRPENDKGVEAWAGQVLNAFNHFQLLCALRAGPSGLSELNPRIARTLHEAGLVSRAEGWYEGRPVIVTRNDYQLGLMNGDVGITLRVPEPDGEARLRVAFQLPNKEIRLVLPSRLDSVETVYAMTVHKSQGSEFDHTALVLPEHDNPVITRELLYTAITRGKQKFTLLVPNPDIPARAIQRRTWRASGLAEALNR